ncbi:N(4)-acetylcytidine aminohydrolase [Vibrio sp. TH_r3]|uniref:N(4)-acetylcytidine aminohydrolase n=1 Tax=Vibrio sp. TH_r3 TaxID=3082084 RepID=UPI0029531CB9|nr:N(4)-acetylcytidine aminohydrolase [Vibrio sp. TH_r3]MDV7105897.1 N(4)-acetylcytidine aminohydrolase [Vibrio sp. TH_r3]
MTFFERFEADILSGKKVITIRDEAEKDYRPGAVVQVSTFETGRWFCDLMIKSVAPIQFDELSEFHANQENMTLSELREVIRSIYPNANELYVISYERVV